MTPPPAPRQVAAPTQAGTPTPASVPMSALQRVDQGLGPLACVLALPMRWLRRRAPVGPEARRVLSIKFWGIGSLQLLTPAARALRERHPRAHLTFLTLASNRAFVEGLGIFDEVITLEVGQGGWWALAKRIAALLRDLRRRRFDEVYDFEFFTRFSALVSSFTGAPRIHGFASPRVWRGWIHTDVVPFNRYWHVARNFRVLAGGENSHNVTVHDLETFEVDGATERRVEALLSELGLAYRPFAVLNPNAGTLSLERRWPATLFAQLARKLAVEDGLGVVLIGAPSEREYTAGVASLVHGDAADSVWNLAGRLDVGELVAVLERASVVVSNDSGPMHIAAAVGAPTVGLFGPETPVMYGPIGVFARALYHPPPCSPCINVHDNKVASCVYGHPQCLVAIPVDEVARTARALMRGEAFELEPRPRPGPPARPAPAEPKLPRGEA